MPIRRTHNEFITELKKVQPNLTVKQKYLDKETKILVEDENGIEYSVAPNSLLNGCPPIILTATDKTKAWITKSRLIHGNKYDYSQSKYNGANVFVKIGCPIHGYFMQRATSHSRRGSGCPGCATEKRNEAVRYNYFSRSGYAKSCNENNRKPYIYIVKCYDDLEQFIKIGMCSTKIYKRFSYTVPYDYKVIGKITGTPEFVYDMERLLHEKYKEYRYTPLKGFPGYTECFTTEILKNINWQQASMWD